MARWNVYPTHAGHGSARVALHVVRDGVEVGVQTIGRADALAFARMLTDLVTPRPMTSGQRRGMRRKVV